MPDTVRWLHVKALQLEASLWMGRVHLQGLLMFIFMGWWAGAAPGESASLVPLAGLCAFVVLGSAAMQIVNDLGDIEGDRVTAPYLPLPAGLLTQRAAGLAACGYLGAGSFVLWWTLPHWRWFVVVLAMVAASLAAFRLYSAVKPLGVITSVIIAFPMGFPLIWHGWSLVTMTPGCSPYCWPTRRSPLSAATSSPPCTTSTWTNKPATGPTPYALARLRPSGS